MIYFDNAATTLHKPNTVSEALVAALTNFGGVGRGVHEASLAAGLAVYRTREQLAALFGAPSARSVAFCYNATEALNVAISGLLGCDDHAITTAASHNSVLRPLYRKTEQGASLSILPVYSDASIDYDEFESLFRPETRLVVVTHASNLTGDVYDVARIAAMCREREVVLVVDAAQTAGLVPINMEQDGIDIVAFTGHKSLFGPQGTGGLCVREGLAIPPFKVGGSGTHSFDKQHPTHLPESLEAGTLNSHGIAGLSAGLEYLESQGITRLREKTEALTARFLTGIERLDPIKVYGRQKEGARCGIVALNVGNLDSAMVADYLSIEYGIAVRSGAHCAPLMHESLGTAEQGIVRFSFSHFNTSEEIDQGIQALASLVREA